jgi:hypothetical protein
MFLHEKTDLEKYWTPDLRGGPGGATVFELSEAVPAAIFCGQDPLNSRVIVVFIHSLTSNTSWGLP